VQAVPKSVTGQAAVGSVRFGFPSRSRRQEHATTAPFDSAAARVATLLDKAGIEPGDRVGVMLPNTAAFAIAFYGIDWSQ
jgi:acyl-CoA synthetase (AMP-forming)/AMP-acid ligase II